MSSVAEELQQIYRNVELLAAQRDEARTALTEAREELADLRRQLAQAEEEIHKRDLDIEFLRLSHRLAEGPQALAEARATVRRMIAGVDKALALLKEDPQA